MVPTQDVVSLALRSASVLPMDFLPAAVVAVVIVAFAIALVTVSLRRRDAE